jgi:autotransporter-associated beta strand protein
MKPTRNPLLRAVTISAIVFVASHTLQAATVYWDSNGTVAGAGTAPAGTWGTSTFWNATADGTTTTPAAWVNGNVAVFSAGADATGGFTVTLSGTPTIGGLTVEEGIPTISGGTALGLTLAATPFNITGTATISSAISGATFGIAKSGPGTLNLNGVIGTTTGGLSVTAGTLVVGSAVNTFTGGVTVSGGTLQMTSGSNGTATAAPLGIFPGGTGFKTISLSNGAVFRPTATYNSNVPTAALPGNGYMFSIGTGGATFDVATGVTLTLDDGNGTGTGTGNAQLQGAGTLTKTGVGILSLGNGTSNFGAFTGAILVNAGTLTTGAVSTTPFGTVATGTTIASGATLDVKAVSIGAEPLTISGLGLASAPAGAITSSTGTGGTATGPVTLAADASIGGAGTLTLSGVISGAFALTKVGVGTAVLSGANTYTGGSVISNGSIQLNNNSAAGPTDGTSGLISLVGGGATNPTRLLINGGVTIANPVTVVNNVFSVAGAGIFQQTGTGQGRLNGFITINGNPSAGGHFVGGGAVGNELVMGGYISSSVAGLSQRSGRVVYAGGGSGWNTLTVTDTAIVGATNGIDTNTTVTLGGSGSATLDLNGFDQSLAGLTLGNVTAANPFTGTVNLGAKTLSLTGPITSQSESTQNVSHAINATVGGALGSGETSVTINLIDTRAADDLVITGATLTGTGGFIKNGPGTLALKNVAVQGPLAVETGSLAIGRITEPLGVTVTANSLSFGVGATALRMKAGPGGDLLTVGSLVTGGTTTVNLLQAGGLLANGTYPLIAYSGTSPGVTGLVLAPVGHTTSTLVDTGTAIVLQVTGNDSVTWDGTNTGDWGGSNTNWKRLSDATGTDYFESDAVIFNDSPFNSTVTIAANVAPTSVTFNNTTLTPYVVTGLGGIIGTTGLTKNGDGALTIETPNAYSGATTVNGGSVLFNFTAGTALPYASSLSVAAGTTVTLAHNGGTFQLASTPLTGAGKVIIDPGLLTAGNRDLATVTWNASAFTGLMRLAPTTGTMRIAVDNINDLGTGPIEIATGGQTFFNAANLTIPNNFTITGTGYVEGAGALGAIRTANPTNLTGIITVLESAKIGAYGGNAVVTNTLKGDATLGGILTFGGNLTSTNSETLTLTGDASGLTGLIVNDGLATAGAATITVNVGNGTTTGTLGTVPVALKADGFKSAVLRFDRSDGYTLGSLITSSATTTPSEVRNSVELDCTGTGFSDNSLPITLGSVLPATGGNIRIGQTRANAIATLTGALTVETLRVATGQNNATLNLGNGAVITSNTLFAGESANNSGTVNQVAGSTVNVLGQVRLGHFATNTSTYNLSGGSLTLTGDSPTKTPSTAAAGGANATGDNNINGGATATLHGGGIYLGNDGCGIFNHTGGTVTTNWMVLDNRGASGAGANMFDGIDRYNLSGDAILNLRSTWGLIGRNDGSYAVSLGGGTIKVDNTGTGTGTGANLTIPLDAILDTVDTTTTTLDTIDATNAFTLTKNVNGTGTLALTGGGTVNLTTTGLQIVTANLSGANPLGKLGAGTTTLAGSMAGYSGNVSVTAGRLNLPASLTSSVTVADGASISGEPTLAGLTLGAATGSTLFCDPTTAGALTVGSLTANGVTAIDVTTLPTGSFTALAYTSKLGSGTFAVANAANYRTAPIVTDTGSAVTVSFSAGNTLTWTGAASTAWNVNLATNWNNGTGSDVFFSGDSVTFPEGGLNPAVVLTGLLAPTSLSVTSETTNYSFTATAGNLITGATGLTKSGASTLTLTGANAYGGATTINGGTVAINGTNSIGNGLVGNTLAISGGSKLSYTGTTALDLGINRPIAIGTGGATLAHNSGTAATINLPGNLSGSDDLVFRSEGTGNGTFTLAGNNSGFTGNITLSAQTTGLTTLNVAPGSMPATSLITITHPAGSTNTGNANGLTLPAGVTLPASTAIRMTSGQPNAGLSLRSQIAVNGNVTINGPISLAGDSIIQVNAGGGSTATLNGNIGETAPGSFTESALLAYSNVLFIRGGGTIVVNGQINLPSPGATVSVTDGTTLVLNPSGHAFRSAAAVFGTIRLGVTNAIPTTARLVLGQAGDQACTLDLNGFDQTVTGLVWSAPTGNNLAKGISNTHPTATSTFTINQTTAPGQTFNGTFSGRINLVKEGAESIILGAAASTLSGNVTVNAGTLVAGATSAATGASGTLGVANLAGKTVTVNPTATLSFTSNNIFGNGVGNTNLPAVIVNGGTVTSTRYNVLGNVVLNGALLTQAATDAGGYQGYQFLGTVTVGGSAASTIATTNGKANHLAASSVFTVPDVTASTAADLTVAAPLNNPSTDITGIGSLVKVGAGTMVLAAGNTSGYTGTTTVNEGTLVVNGTLGVTDTTVAAGATLSGSGSIGGAVTVNGNVVPGTGIGTLATGAATFSATGSMAAEINSATVQSDKLAVTGNLTLDAATTLTLTDLGAATAPGGAKLVLISYTGTWNGTPFVGKANNSKITIGTNEYTLKYDDSVSGTNAVTLSTPGGYGVWAAAFGLTGDDALRTADPDKDGQSNFLEYATNADPTKAGSRARVYSAMATIGADQVLTLTVATRKNAVFAANGTKQTATIEDVVYTAEGSDDVTTWTTVQVTEVTGAAAAAVQASLGALLTTPPLEAQWEWHTFRTDGGAPSDPTDFIRLAVTPTAP